MEVIKGAEITPRSTIKTIIAIQTLAVHGTIADQISVAHGITMGQTLVVHGTTMGQILTVQGTTMDQTLVCSGEITDPVSIRWVMVEVGAGETEIKLIYTDIM